MSTSRALLRGAILLLAVCALAVPLPAQFTSRISGDVKDAKGEPYPGVSVTLKNLDKGQTLEVKTDAKGRYVATGLQAGLWALTFTGKGPQGQDITIYEAQMRLQTGAEERVDVSVKDLIEKMGAAQKAEMKKQEEEQNKFNSMKGHFDAGRAALEQVRATRAEILKTPKAEQAPLLEKAKQQADTAATEFEQARAAVDPKDSNYAVVLSNLGEAYEEAGRYPDAVAAYQAAVDSAPQQGNLYVKLGTAQARAGKVEDAMASCGKVMSLPTSTGQDPKSAAASCYGNVGIVLQNAGKMKESIDPLKKATEITPAQADYWFLLGRGLTAAMEYKKEGDKFVTVVPPGTAESYAKYLELAPNGRFAADAKGSLDMLAQVGVITTKVSTKKKN